MKFSFDECFQTFPPVPAPGDLEAFWKEALAGLRKVPVDPKQKLVLSKSLGWESLSEVSFSGAGGYRLRGLLSVPRKRGKAPAVISFHDYHGRFEMDRSFTQEGLAHLAIQLRGHEDVPSPEEPARQPSAASPARSGRGTGNSRNAARRVGAAMAEREEAARDAWVQQGGLDQLESSYPVGCFLDAVRCIDFLRLNKGIDASRIGLLGRGFGSAMAIFAAAHMPENVRALALERPGFVWIQQWLEEARSDLRREINALMNQSARAKTRLKKNLAYLDGLNWSEQLDRPLIASIALADEWNPPRPAFGFFNRLQTDKSMEIYPEESAEPGQKEERKKSLRFLAEHLI